MQRNTRDTRVLSETVIKICSLWSWHLSLTFPAYTARIRMIPIWEDPSLDNWVSWCQESIHHIIHFCENVGYIFWFCCAGYNWGDFHSHRMLFLSVPQLSVSSFLIARCQSNLQSSLMSIKSPFVLLWLFCALQTPQWFYSSWLLYPEGPLVASLWSLNMILIVHS